MPAALIVQLVAALIGQMPTIVALVEKLVAEKRDPTDAEVATLKDSSPIAYALLTATQTKAACACGAVQPMGVRW